MIREIVKDPVFLQQKSLPATEDDLSTGLDLLDTLSAHRETCVGLAANMIGISRRIIVFDDGGKLCLMFNPEIVQCSGPAFPQNQGSLSGRAFPRSLPHAGRLDGSDRPARDRPLQRHFDLTAFFPPNWPFPSGFPKGFVLTVFWLLPSD